jgi:hypothetical protein
MKTMSFRPIRSEVGTVALVALTLGVCPSAHSADDGGRLMLQFSPGVLHFNTDPDHAEYSWMVGGEYLWPNGWLAGYAYFNNSFDQKSHYIYGGHTWVLNGNVSRYWYFKLTAGAIVGYREPYEDKIPFNDNGVAPGIIPGLGYQFDRFNVQLNILGTAGLSITVGYDVVR